MLTTCIESRTRRRCQTTCSPAHDAAQPQRSGKLLPAVLYLSILSRLGRLIGTSRRRTMDTPSVSVVMDAENLHVEMAACLLALVLGSLLRIMWREVLRRQLNKQLNEIWRQEHEEAEVGETSAILAIEARPFPPRPTAIRSPQSVAAPTLYTWYAIPRFTTSQPPRQMHQPPIPLLPCPGGSASQSASNTCGLDRSD